ncbi:MAG TPA: hypothetical protein VMF58_04785 [Rhizomicrobium sp.]|nr:hypothetical protein [Rhizomicrobium sp.]
MPRKKKATGTQAETQQISKPVLSKEDREEVERLKATIAELKAEITRDSDMVAELRANIARNKEKLGICLARRQALLNSSAPPDRLI